MHSKQYSLATTSILGQAPSRFCTVEGVKLGNNKIEMMLKIVFRDRKNAMFCKTPLIKNEFEAKFFQPRCLKDIFEYLFHYAITQPLTLVVDEFQDIEKINNSLFSDLQHLWDSYKNTTMMHFVCCGSEHRTYFDVLGAIANGYTARARIENYQVNYQCFSLDNLDDVFDLSGSNSPAAYCVL